MVSAKALMVAAKRGISTLAAGLSVRTGVPFTKPSMVYIQVTDKCNARCPMCEIWQRHDQVEHVPLDKLKLCIDRLGAWLGRTHIQLGTGEPFLHPGMMQVVEYGNSKGMLMGTVSNGLLIGDKTARGIIENNFFNINISLDGVEPETHEFTRGIPGAHGRVMEAIDRLLFYKEKLGGSTRVMIKPMIFNRNVDQLVPLARLARDKGLAGINFQPMLVVNEASAELARFDDLASLDAAFAELKALRREGYPILNTDREFDAFFQYFQNPRVRPKLLDNQCPVGFTNLWVMEGGVVHLCTMFDEPVGHVDDYGGSFKRLWRSPEARRVRDVIARCKRPCLAVCLIRRTLGEQIGRFFRFMRGR